EGAPLPALTSALAEVTALPGDVETETVPAMGAEERLVGIMAGPLRRVLQDRRAAPSKGWPELLALLNDILGPRIGLGVGASRPPFKPVPFTGHGYTILVRAGALAARTSAGQPVDLRHLLGAALALNSDVLPPAPLAWAGWRQSAPRSDPISNQIRI